MEVKGNFCFFCYLFLFVISFGVLIPISYAERIFRRTIYTTSNLFLFRTNIASGCLSDTQILFSLIGWLAKDSNTMKETIIYSMSIIWTKNVLLSCQEDEDVLWEKEKQPLAANTFSNSWLTNKEKMIQWKDANFTFIHLKYYTLFNVN
jgi:hypothetical protein